MPLEQRGRALYPSQVPHEITVPDWRVFDLLEHAVKNYGDHDALIFYDGRLTYRELWESARRFGGLLQQIGVKALDRVALMLPNCPQYVIAYYGCLMAGAIVTQVNPMLVERELQYVLEDSESQILVALDALLPRISKVRSNTALKTVVGVSLTGASTTGENVVDFGEAMASATALASDGVCITAGDVAVLQYTGGTTGLPKAAMLTHRNLVANVLQLNAFSEFYPGEERVLAVIPLFHVYGMTVSMNLGLYLGACIVLLPRFELSEVLDAIRLHRISLWPGVPTMYTALLKAPHLEPESVQSIRICNSGSAPMPVELMQQFEERTGAEVAEGYGLSETSPVTHGHAGWMTKKPGTVGIALPSTEYRIVDPATLKDVDVGELGEVWIRGPQVMKGYWNRPDETKATLVEDGWLRTGDLGCSDHEGYLSLMDRLKDLIIASGYNVYPREIEEVLYAHPGVMEAVVVGAQDPYRGETVRAVVVKKPESHLTQESLSQYLKENLAAYKCPTIIEFREELPKSAVGKILRRVVREQPVEYGG